MREILGPRPILGFRREPTNQLPPVTSDQQREFIFRALKPGLYRGTSVLRQVGFEYGVRTFELRVVVRAPET